MRLNPASRPKKKGTPRAKVAVRARIAHTANNGRRLDLFVTEPVYSALGWKMGGAIAGDFIRNDGNQITVAWRAAHSGWRLHPAQVKTKTARISVSTTHLAPSICAPVRDVPHEIDGDLLTISLPAAWFEPGIAA